MAPPLLRVVGCCSSGGCRRVAARPAAAAAVSAPLSASSSPTRSCKVPSPPTTYQRWPGMTREGGSSPSPLTTTTSRPSAFLWLWLAVCAVCRREGDQDVRVGGVVRPGHGSYPGPGARPAQEACHGRRQAARTAAEARKGCSLTGQAAGRQARWLPASPARLGRLTRRRPRHAPGCCCRCSWSPIPR